MTKPDQFYCCKSYWWRLLRAEKNQYSYSYALWRRTLWVANNISKIRKGWAFFVWFECLSYLLTGIFDKCVITSVWCVVRSVFTWLFTDCSNSYRQVPTWWWKHLFSVTRWFYCDSFYLRNVLVDNVTGNKFLQRLSLVQWFLLLPAHTLYLGTEKCSLDCKVHSFIGSTGLSVLNYF